MLAEFYQGELQLLPNDKPWHLATNFVISAVNGSAVGQCARYDRLEGQLSTTDGNLDAGEAMSLLQDVSQASTQWSIVYGFSTGDVTVTMGQQYDRIHTFHIDLME
ncbi:MAG: hypothetical protein MUO77_10325 [Anaerolineales bacterium]|nr:hypothetical protein [Anaerolineales bacterium]